MLFKKSERGWKGAGITRVRLENRYLVIQQLYEKENFLLCYDAR
ncbi:hypothetical protein Pryu01_01895 [Paraliobacillus ryukyuensis]|uniref:Uncharacterized protein n=1 Tax=Paraliobacillus ryukyuensis TaxID=200904 RepID=A0A366DUH1_9BACI|nr:hypothetical protein DES48_1135 [Paraliobacillus ryukyuensis]